MTTKGLALGRPRKLEKDSYDIYAVAGFCKGHPNRAAAHFRRLIKTHGNGNIPSVTRRALKRIGESFASPNNYTPLAVSRFMEEDVSVDASERVSAFLTQVKKP